MTEAMKTLRSHLCGQWYEASRDFQTLLNPSTEEPLARASSTGADLPGALSWARERGGPALRTLSFAQRGEILKALGKRLREHREELLALSSSNNGSTATDGAFDIDGAGGALAFYGGLGIALGTGRVLADGEGGALGKSENFWSAHALVPRRGVAIHINAFNFPAWGFAEKFACSFLAGMPTITKPATATALVAHRMIEIAVDSGLLPEGALQLIVGSTGDLLDRLEPQDVVAFTGSAATALSLRQRPAVALAGARFNVEADSLNAAVLAPDVHPGSPTFDRFVQDVTREITQKAGQKCTAVRRILTPKETAEQVIEALVARLATVVTGDPADPRVTMGPLAHGGQLRDAMDGIAELLATARLVHGSGGRAAGVGAPAGKGFFVEPTLLRSEVPLDEDAGALARGLRAGLDSAALLRSRRRGGGDRRAGGRLAGLLDLHRRRRMGRRLPRPGRRLPGPDLLRVGDLRGLRFGSGAAAVAARRPGKGRRRRRARWPRRTPSLPAARRPAGHPRAGRCAPRLARPSHRFRREALQMPVTARRRDRGPRRRTFSTSSRPTERNAAGMGSCGAAAEVR